MTLVLREEIDAADRMQQERNEARHIKNNVDKARKNPQISGERWPFELLQNALDTGPRDGLSHVDINVTWERADGGTAFIFKHNGAPFLPQDLVALLSGGSNKDEKSQETVGRFGTGFLVTHVLSPRTQVGGLIKTRAGMERFSVTLNRFGDLKDILQNVKDCKADLEKSVPVIDMSDLPSAEFTYLVDDGTSMEKGLDSLRQALPYLYATCTSLGVVSLRDRAGEHETWKTGTADEVVEADGIVTRDRALHVHHAGGGCTEFRVFSVSTRNDTLSAIVVAQLVEGVWRICAPADTLPRMFRRFPILHSSALPIGFVLDGLFNVGEDRQKVYFETADDEERVREALSLIPVMMGHLLGKNWEGIHLLCRLAGPVQSSFIDEDRVDWWRAELLRVAQLLSEMSLVSTNRGGGPAVNSGDWYADFVSPLFSSSVPRVIPHERLWELMSGSDYFIPPNLNISPYWTEIARGWKDLGVDVQLVTLESLASQIRKSDDETSVRSVNDLPVRTEKLEWLALFFDLVGESLEGLEAIDVGVVEGLLPDQRGRLRSPRDLRRDAGVSEGLKDIAGEIGTDVRPLLVDKEIIAVAQRLGLPHTEVAINKLMAKGMTEDEVLERCLTKLDEKLISGKQIGPSEENLLKGSVRLLAHVWRIKGSSGKAIAKRCPLIASDNSILRHIEGQRVMPPVARWPEEARRFHEAYPEQRVLAPVYAGNPSEGIPDVVDALSAWGITYGDLLTEATATLDGDRLKAASDYAAEAEGVTVSGVSFSQIALLARELIPRSGNNFAAAKALLGLALAYITPRDPRWRNKRTVEGKKAADKVSLSVRDALWVTDLQYRAWVPEKGDQGKTISVVANSSNLEALLDPEWLRGNNDAIDLLSQCFHFDALKLRLLVAATDEEARQKIRDDLAKLVEVAGSDLDILSGLASDIEARKKQKRDISRWSKLGLAVQDAVRDSLEAKNLRVDFKDVGGDFIVVLQQGGLIDEAALSRLQIHDFIVEVKATTHGEVRMTPTQAVNAASKPERYVLCVVDLRGMSELDLDRDWTAERVEPLMLLMTDIGNYVRDTVDLVEAARNCDVRIRNEALLRYGVPPNVWGIGQSLDEWLASITGSVI